MLKPCWNVLNLLAGQQLLPLLPEVEMIEEFMVTTRGFNQIIGHDLTKRALEIAASGGHYVLMDGPPGYGKSLLAETFPTILPSLSKESHLDKISLYQLPSAPYSSLAFPPWDMGTVLVSLWKSK